MCEMQMNKLRYEIFMNLNKSTQNGSKCIWTNYYDSSNIFGNDCDLF